MRTAPDTDVVFTKRLREGIRRGRIRCTIRIWTRLQVKVRGKYAMDEGHVVVDSIEAIRMRDITQDLARESGFDSERSPRSRTPRQWTKNLSDSVSLPAPWSVGHAGKGRAPSI